MRAAALTAIVFASEKLSGLVDHQQIEAADRHAAGMREVPSRPADHATGGGVREEAGVLGGGEGGPRWPGAASAFFATIEPSSPASTTASNMFSTTECDWATTPICHPCSATRDATTRPPVYVLPVPGGPCTARYESSRSTSAVAMAVAGSHPAIAGSPDPLRSPRRNPAQDVRCRVRG
ncbi:hypothetical protein GS425_17165 [Rhodococcus hoagii]|nr:hypothetical protein [Prescottella equi]